MGNKSFDKVKFKTLLTEASSRMTIKRGKKVNELYRVRDKIIDFVKNGDMSSALIYIDNYINEENKLKVYDALWTMWDQMKGRITEIESYGITDDLSPNANAIVFSSQRLEIKELQSIAEIMEDVMPKADYKAAIGGACYNEIIRDNISYRKWEKGEAYLKLIELWRETETHWIIKEEWKKVLREYWYKNEIEYPYSVEDDIGYSPGGGSAPIPAPMPAPYYPPGGYAPAPGGYVPAPGGYAPAPGGYVPAPSGYAPAPGGYAPAPGYYDPTAYPADSSQVDPPVKPSKGKGGISGGYSLPPPPDMPELPKYGVPSKEEDLPPSKKPAKDDDSDDEDLMERLRKLQK